MNLEQLILWGGIGYSALMLLSYAYAIYLGYKQAKVLHEVQHLNLTVNAILWTLKDMNNGN